MHAGKKNLRVRRRVQKPPKLEPGKRTWDEKFHPMTAEEKQMQDMQANLKESGMSGTMYRREDLAGMMDKMNEMMPGMMGEDGMGEEVVGEEGSVGSDDSGLSPEDEEAMAAKLDEEEAKQEPGGATQRACLHYSSDVGSAAPGLPSGDECKRASQGAHARRGRARDLRGSS